MATMSAITRCNMCPFLLPTSPFNILIEWWETKESKFKKRQPISGRQ